MDEFNYPLQADLVVFAGQSNMSGRGNKSEAPVCLQGAGFEYRPISCSDQLLILEEPFGIGEDKPNGLNDLNPDGTTKRSGSMVTSFVNAYYQFTNRPIVAVSASKGGSHTVEWLDTLLDDAISRLDATVSFMNKKNIKVGRAFLVWSQGESDGDGSITISKNDYMKNTRLIFERFLEHGLEHCFIVQTGHYNYPAYGRKHIDASFSVIQEAQQELTKEDSRYTLVSSFIPYLDYMRDEFHFHQTAYNMVGYEAGKNTADYYNAQI